MWFISEATSEDKDALSECEPPYENNNNNKKKQQQKSLCAQRRLRSAWASAQSDPSLRSALNG